MIIRIDVVNLLKIQHRVYWLLVWIEHHTHNSIRNQINPFFRPASLTSLLSHPTLPHSQYIYKAVFIWINNAMILLIRLSISLIFLLTIHFCLNLFLFFSFRISLHLANQSIHIAILNLILGHLHWILYHLIDQLHSFLFCCVGPHILIELFYIDFVLGTTHNVSHSVHDIWHLIHSLHGLQSTLQN